MYIYLDLYKFNFGSMSSEQLKIMLNVNFEAMDIRNKIEELLTKEYGWFDPKKVDELLNLHSVSESYIKCWNCKQFEQTGTNTMGNEVGHCKLNDCSVSHPKWQKCGEYEQCGNFR